MIFDINCVNGITASLFFSNLKDKEKKKQKLLTLKKKSN